MDKTDHEWFQNSARLSCPKLTHLEYETIVDKLENASTRILIALDEARSLLPTLDESHLKAVYAFWHERRSTRVTRTFSLSLSVVVEVQKTNFFVSSRIFSFASFLTLIRTNAWNSVCSPNVTSKKRRASIIPTWHFEEEWRKWPPEKYWLYSRAVSRLSSRETSV